MTEDIIRRIRELEERIRNRQETTDYLQTILRLIQEEHPSLTHKELIQLPDYRHTYYSTRSLEGWQTRDRKELEELKKLIPPYTHKRIRLTFSIETGKGHEPFLAEVTCNTVIPKETSRKEENEIVKRVVHATIKYFWIVFDVWKDITKDMELFWEAELYSKLLKRAIFFQKYAETIEESALDDFLLELSEHGGLTKSPAEYVTTEAILNIGIEPPFPADEKSEPRYPKVHVFIDKKEKYEFRKDVYIIIAPELRFNILRVLGIELEITREEE